MCAGASFLAGFVGSWWGGKLLAGTAAGATAVESSTADMAGRRRRAAGRCATVDR